MQKRNLIIFIILLVLACFCKQLIVYDLPILNNATMTVDDALMVNQAVSISSGKWLGEYNLTTFMKGVFFPIFLSILHLFKLNYLYTITFLYSIACLYFIYVLSKRINSKVVLFLIFLGLEFNPVMYNNMILLRVYRNSLLPMQTLILIAVYINLLLLKNADIKKKTPSIILLSFDVVSIWLSREDAIWILPLCIFMSLIILIKNKKFWTNLFLLLIPLIVTVTLCQVVRLINYNYYGVYTLRNENWYNKAVKSINSIKTDVKVERVTNTREKMNRIAKYTIFGEVIDSFNNKAEGYANLDDIPSNYEVAHGWFKFVLVEAVLEHGYYETPQKTNEFYKTLYEDIEKAIEDGNLEKDETKEYGKMIKETSKYTLEVCKYVFNFEGAKLDIYDLGTTYRKFFKNIFINFTEITRNKTVWEKDSELLSDGTEIIDFDKQQEYLDSISYKNKISNILVQLHKILNYILVPTGLIYYIYLSFRLIKNGRKNFDNKVFENWVLLSSIIGVFATITVGIAYTTYKYFMAIMIFYLSVPFTLIVAFDLISVYNIGEEIYIRLKKVKEKE